MLDLLTCRSLVKDWKSLEVKTITGIVSVTEGEAYPTDFFSIDGTRRDGPQKGLNIIRMSDGTTKNILIK